MKDFWCKESKKEMVATCKKFLASPNLVQKTSAQASCRWFPSIHLALFCRINSTSPSITIIECGKHQNIFPCLGLLILAQLYQSQSIESGFLNLTKLFGKPLGVVCQPQQYTHPLFCLSVYLILVMSSTCFWLNSLSCQKVDHKCKNLELEDEY